MTAAYDDVLPARQTRALVAAGYRDWPSPRRAQGPAAMMYLACIGVGIVLAITILLAVDSLAERRRRKERRW